MLSSNSNDKGRYCNTDQSFSYKQKCMNPARQLAVATRFFTVAHNTCVLWLWNLLHINLLMTRILRWLLKFWKIVLPCL
jgi:hypothetical protein